MRTSIGFKFTAVLFILSLSGLNFSLKAITEKPQQHTIQKHGLYEHKGIPNAPDLIKFQSKILNEERKLYLQLPEGFSSTSKKYPLLIVLDAEWLFHLANANQRFYSYDRVTDRNIPRMIVVGIENIDRDRDYTPTSDSGNNLKFSTAGKADIFLEFLEKELIPMLEDKYRAAPYRGIIGWSFSGLFAAYSAIAKPDLFNTHLCISPAVWWDNDLIQKRIESTPFKKHKRFFFSLGSNERDSLVGKSTNRLLLRFKSHPISNLIVDSIEIKDVGHTWGISEAMNKGLQKLFSDYFPPNEIIKNGYKEIELYYSNLSQRWGYEIVPPKEVLFTIAMNLFKEKKNGEAIKILKHAISISSDDAFSYFGLGKIYSSEKNYTDALSMFRAAFKAENSKSVPNRVYLAGFENAIKSTEKLLKGLK